MKITDIRSSNTQDAKLPLFKPDELSKQKIEKNIKSDKLELDTSNKDIASDSWQKDILLNALESLENSHHVEDNHPLGKISNAPIETYEEALIELSFIRSPKFKETAYNSQANLNPEDVLYLFKEEYV